MMTPIIMEESLEVVENKVQLLRQRGEARVHFDIGDGLFSELLSVTPADLASINLEGLGIDIHLLVDDPTEWLQECVVIKPKRVIGQIERMGSQTGFVEEVIAEGAIAGLALELATPVASLEKEALEKCEVVLLLSVPAGTSGSKFDERVISKIGELREIYKGNILVDGGINQETEKLVMEAGASETGMNSYYWKELAK